MSIVILIKIRYNVTVRHKRGISPGLGTVEKNMHDRMKKMKAVWLPILAAALVSAGCSDKDGESLEELSVSAESETEEEGAVPQEEQEPAETVYVYVCGAVNAPGVYELKKDTGPFPRKDNPIITPAIVNHDQRHVEACNALYR